jgi:hypothetical protein
MEGEDDPMSITVGGQETAPICLPIAETNTGLLSMAGMNSPVNIVAGNTRAGEERKVHMNTPVAMLEMNTVLLLTEVAGDLTCTVALPVTLLVMGVARPSVLKDSTSAVKTAMKAINTINMAVVTTAERTLTIRSLFQECITKPLAFKVREIRTQQRVL